MNRDYEQFPDDDNGNVLWQMVEDGDDLTELHEIEFSIAFQDQQNAEQCAM
ncbi:TPA: ribonuclease E inhibitor RraB, partial [Escherichia coli]|nr:ribonuclease E inhibitor RraB [Escherichia coli]